MTPAGDAPTYSVAQLCGEVKAFLTEAFPPAWVAGEVQRVHRSQRGHLYFELIEKGRNDAIVGKLDAVIWRSALRRVEAELAATGQRIAPGQQIRCLGSLDFYPPGGRLQMVVRQVDPVFTLGLLEKRRRETLAWLDAQGLLERNRALTLTELPLDLGLVTSEGSAAYHDFLSTLSESGYGFRVRFVHAAVQGSGAEAEIASALRCFSGSEVAAVALVRGGGARTDLAVFDTREVASAIAEASVPVLTGLGHQTDEAIADRVAHTPLKTPTKAAELFVERVGHAELRLLGVWDRLLREALEPVRRQGEALRAAERGVELALGGLRRAGLRLEQVRRAVGVAGSVRLREGQRRNRELGERLDREAGRLVARRRSAPDDLAARLAAASRARLGPLRATLDGMERLCRDLSPERTLERGFSITRDEEGALVRDPTGLSAGGRIITRVAGGELVSRLEES